MSTIASRRRDKVEETVAAANIRQIDAMIQQTKAYSIKALIDAGFDRSTVVAAVAGDDLTRLKKAGI
jgi:Trk K+ transport system NAD-binding subunit